MSSDALYRPEVRKDYPILIEQDWTDVIGHLYPDERIYSLIESCTQHGRPVRLLVRPSHRRRYRPQTEPIDAITE
ncbi:hypothetical protein GGE35_002750 [Rhizobium cellulosilyticum]|uniref:Uncharacterized protein n=1 Tax=Aliirhizobium cellulosilyticum TaxID=393664 RepID=A0A7W6S951_9HYPH|nr:hypothetical protein [Rhizobium cellulosilyticum]MBB4412297.1 hypothetical protein [Rhizobium cellulosilyticum]MBB4446928.1 hypothetical protein [Rhizobium cellulosilyticum]